MIYPSPGPDQHLLFAGLVFYVLVGCSWGTGSRKDYRSPGLDQHLYSPVFLFHALFGLGKGLSALPTIGLAALGT